MTRSTINLHIYELVLLLSREITQSFQDLLEPKHPAVLSAIQYFSTIFKKYAGVTPKQFKTLQFSEESSELK